MKVDLAAVLRWFAEGLAAAAASYFGGRYVTPPTADAFHSTLILVPWVVLALIWTERWGRLRGGRRIDADASGVEATVLVLLWILTARHQELGLVALEPFLAAAWLLLLGQRVVRQGVALRPCLGRRLPRRPSWVFAWLPLVVYVALQPWMGEQRGVDGDEPYYLLVTHSIAFDGDIDLSNNYGDDWRRFTDRPLQPQPGDPVGPDGQLRSRHSALLPLFLAPVYRLFGLTGVRLVMALATACLAWMVLRLAYRYRPQAVTMAWWIWGWAAFGPPLLLYSYQVWAEIPAALLLAVALDQVQAMRQRADDETRWTIRQGVLLLVPLALLPWLKLRFGLVSLGLLALLMARGGLDRRRMVRLAALAGALFGALLLVNSWRYGHPLGMHRWGELSAGAGFSGAGLRGALGLFYDVAFGLFGVAPWWLLLLPAAVRCWQIQRGVLLDLVAVAGPYLVLLWPRSEWYGGWSPPFRYGLIFLPLLAVMLLALHDDRRRPGFRWANGVLGGLTLVLSVFWVVKPGWTYNFADGGTLLLHHAAGYLDTDVVRFFPSWVRPRLASWLWPLASLLLIPLTLRTRHRRWYPAAPWVAAAVLLTSLLVGLAVARQWPTAVVEVEDGYVEKSDGVPFPPRWSVRRADYRGGWQLPLGARLEAPVQNGGDRVRLTVRAIAVGPRPAYELRVAADDEILATVSVAVGDWQRIELQPVDWPPGAELVLAAPATVQGPGGVVVDRVEFSWQ